MRKISMALVGEDEQMSSINVIYLRLPARTFTFLRGEMKDCTGAIFLLLDHLRKLSSNYPVVRNSRERTGLKEDRRTRENLFIDSEFELYLCVDLTSLVSKRSCTMCSNSIVLLSKAQGRCRTHQDVGLRNGIVNEVC